MYHEAQYDHLIFIRIPYRRRKIDRTMNMSIKAGGNNVSIHLSTNQKWFTFRANVASDGRRVQFHYNHIWGKNETEAEKMWYLFFPYISWCHSFYWLKCEIRQITWLWQTRDDGCGRHRSRLFHCFFRFMFFFFYSRTTMYRLMYRILSRVFVRLRAFWWHQL